LVFPRPGADYVAPGKNRQFKNSQLSYKEAVLVGVKILREVNELPSVPCNEEVRPAKHGFLLVQVLYKAIPRPLHLGHSVFKVHDGCNRVEGPYLKGEMNDLTLLAETNKSTGTSNPLYLFGPVLIVNGGRTNVAAGNVFPPSVPNFDRKSPVSKLNLLPVQMSIG
jgi:hypothetical protein